MITELEQDFFKVFGIEPIPIKSYGCWLINGSIAENDKGEKVVYPEITDRRLLEMICIVVKSKALLPIFISENIKNLKDEIIQMTIDSETKFKHNNKIDFKHQIQQLFKEGGMNIINIVFSIGFFVIIIHCVYNNQIPPEVGLFVNAIMGFIMAISIAEDILK